MGQYHAVFNLAKRQWINPRELGDGLKLFEFGGSPSGGVGSALTMLLACTSGRGGGDFQSDDALIGSWAGDRIAIIGDYAAAGDLVDDDLNAAEIYSQRDSWPELSSQLRPLMEREYEVVYAIQDGCMERYSLCDIHGWSSSHGMSDRTIVIGLYNYRASALIKAAREFLESNPSQTIRDFVPAQHAKKAIIS